MKKEQSNEENLIYSEWLSSRVIGLFLGIT